MAFKLTKSERKEYDAIAAELTSAAESLTAALEAYNLSLEKARSFAEDIHSEYTSQLEDRSENYQNGEKGDAANAWLDAWNEVELDALDITDHTDHVEAFNDLPMEAEQ